MPGTPTGAHWEVLSASLTVRSTHAETRIDNLNFELLEKQKQTRATLPNLFERYFVYCRPCSAFSVAVETEPTLSVALIQHYTNRGDRRRREKRGCTLAAKTALYNTGA